MKKQTTARTDNETTTVSRRTCIKTLGAGASLLAIESGTATAASHGYGAGGYGDSEYGHPGTSLAVTTDGITDISETAATLNGSLTNLGDASSTEVYFDYRETSASTWSSTAVQTMSSTNSFTADLTSLSDGVAYEYRAVATASDGSSDSGSTSEFTTVKASVVNSTDDTVDVVTDAVTDVGETTATVNGSLTNLGGASSTEVYFDYRETSASTWSSTAVQTMSSINSFTADLTSLSDGVAYEYKAVATASDGSSDSGSTSEFTTGEAPVVVSTENAIDITETTATLTGSVTDLGNASSADVAFEYRATGQDSWTATTVQTLSSTGTFSVSVTDLPDGTEHEFKATAEASDGSSNSGSTSEFTTGEAPVVVSTDDAVDVTETTATLTGSVTDLGNASSADVMFEYRAIGQDSWTATTVQTLSSTGTFSASVSDLPDGTEHEFKATAEASDGDTDTGAQAVFTTVTVESDPIIDSYSVSDAGSPNPHAEINTEWAVSDADGDLSAVTVSISDYSSETTLRSSETSVSDTNASGSDSFKIKHSDGAAFDVTLRVKDNAGNAASETKSISA